MYVLKGVDSVCHSFSVRNKRNGPAGPSDPFTFLSPAFIIPSPYQCSSELFSREKEPLNQAAMSQHLYSQIRTHLRMDDEGLEIPNIGITYSFHYLFTLSHNLQFFVCESEQHNTKPLL